MIDIDQAGDGGNLCSLSSHTLQFAAIEDEGGIEGFDGREFAGNPVALREKPVIFRCRVLIVDSCFFTHLPEHMVEGQFRTKGVAVESLVCRDQKRTSLVDQFTNPVEHCSPFHDGFP